MISRRKFFQFVAVTIGMFTPLFPSRAQAKKVALDLDKVEKLKKVGGWSILKIKDKQFLFIRDTEKTVKVLSPLCTHKKCTVAFNPESKKIECPCHQSLYDLNGKVLKGPASKSLKLYESSLSEEKDKIVFSIE